MAASEYGQEAVVAMFLEHSAHVDLQNMVRIKGWYCIAVFVKQVILLSRREPHATFHRSQEYFISHLVSVAWVYGTAVCIGAWSYSSGRSTSQAQC